VAVFFRRKSLCSFYEIGADAVCFSCHGQIMTAVAYFVKYIITDGSDSQSRTSVRPPPENSFGGVCGFPIKILGTVFRALASENETRRRPRRAFRRGLSLWKFSFHLRWDTRLAYTGMYPIPSVCQHAQPSAPNAEGNPRNQPEISVRKSTAKIVPVFRIRKNWIL
jgi:hypothetical protein